MAGRKSSLARVVAAGVAALSAVGVPPASAATVDGPIVVSQVRTNSSITFGRRAGTGHVQKLAQTFRAPKGAHKLSSVSLILAGHSNAVVKIYDVGKRAPFGTRLAKRVVAVDYEWGDPGSSWVYVRIRPAVVVQPGRRYSLVLTAERRRKSFASAGENGNYRRGQQWCFCPLWTNGGVDFENARWQSAKELDAPALDLAFKLRFQRRG
jgi:hypothetical protein